MSKVKFDELKKGSVIESKKKGEIFEVVEVTPERKAQLKNAKTLEVTTLSASTIERWYVADEYSKVTTSEAADTSVPTKPSGPSVARPRRSGRAIPKPKIEEPIEASGEVEEIVSTSDSAEPKRKPAPKKESVMAITKELEAKIREMFPASERIVTGSYIAYRTKKQFVTIEESRKGVMIGVRTSGIDKELKKKLTKVVPKSYGWVIDGFYRVKTEEGIETALELIEASHLSSL